MATGSLMIYTNLIWIDVTAVRVDVGIVSEQSVHIDSRSVRNRGAEISGHDDMSRITILSHNSQAKRLALHCERSERERGQEDIYLADCKVVTGSIDLILVDEG